MGELTTKDYRGIIQDKKKPWDQVAIPPVDTTRDYILIEVVSPEAAGELYYYYGKDVQDKWTVGANVKITVATFYSGPDRPIVIDIKN